MGPAVDCKVPPRILSRTVGTIYGHEGTSEMQARSMIERGHFCRSPAGLPTLLRRAMKIVIIAQVRRDYATHTVVHRRIISLVTIDV